MRQELKMHLTGTRSHSHMSKAETTRQATHMSVSRDHMFSTQSSKNQLLSANTTSQVDMRPRTQQSTAGTDPRSRYTEPRGRKGETDSNGTQDLLMLGIG
ncbi:Hypothetical predicted protein [Pelobates cultripes]|uniref:Uncharacterized protein n=1 Tax=Pelobates cultripes TaxID=61616 RepID=A0AAD1RTZ0_PELCU|nr:Hypothetical predicted protein [Pelobates cultripes]